MGFHKKPSTTLLRDTFEDLKKEILKIDPVSFCENHLTIDGHPVQLSGTGWKFLSEMYRYVGTKALEKDGKPVVCVKGRQVGATTMAAFIEMYYCTSGIFGATPNRPAIRVLHCFPSLNNVGKFVKGKLDEVMRCAQDNYVFKQGIGYDEKTGKRKSSYPDDTYTEKFFQNDNRLWVDSNGQLAVRLQGLTLDCIFHDEVQRMLKDDIENGLRTLTASRYGPIGKGIQLYFGTPLNKGSYFWKLWNASDKRYYHLGCTNCGHYFMLYTPGSDDWEKIWVHGNIVQCPKCNTQQSKLDAVDNGKWIATQAKMDNGADPIYVGFHFNQFLIPAFTKEVIQSENPKYNPTKSDRIWTTDILGEFYSGAAMPMTEEEVYQYCKNPNRACSSGVANNDIQTFMGIDWGGKEDNEESTGGQSFSTILVASAGKDGTFQIENAFKLKKNDLEYKKSVIREMYRRFNVKLTVADIGFGNDIVPELQREYQTRFWGCFNSGTLIKPLKVVEDNLSIICNKDLVLDDIFNTMRKSKILFPLKDSDSFEQMNWLIEHCCSMERVTRTVQGNVVHKYIKGTGPNDGLMALMYAWIAYKFFITRGFKVKEHQVGVKTNGPILAHLPRL